MINHIDSVSISPHYHVMGIVSYLCGLPPKSIWPLSDHEKDIRQNKTDGYCTSLWEVLLNIAKAIKTKKKIQETVTNQGNLKKT